MDLLEKCSILYFHKKCIEENGIGTFGSLGWEQETGQQKRFEVLAKIGNLNNSSIVDLGCGYGDLKLFLNQHFEHFKYTGIDFMPEFIEEAKKKFANCPDTEFLRKDFSESDIPNADYIFASGVFCYRSNETAYYIDLIKKMISHANKGIGFNMLNIATFPHNTFLKAHELSSTITLCKSIGEKVVVTQNYLPDDFTIFVYTKH